MLILGKESVANVVFLPDVGCHNFGRAHSLLLAFCRLHRGLPALRLRVEKIKKLWAVESYALRAMRSKYGASISKAKHLYAPYVADEERAFPGILTMEKTIPIHNPWGQIFEQAIPGPPAQRHARLFESLDPLMDRYPAMQPEERVAIRQLMSNHFWVLRDYQYSASSLLLETTQPLWLRRGLAAASIENCQCDFRESIATLDTTLTTAAELGLAWRDALFAVAAISDDGEPFGGGKGTPWLSTRAYLEARARMATEGS